MSDRAWRWRIGVASALLGASGVAAALRHELGTGWAVGLVAVLAAAAVLAMRGVHHRVDQSAARRNVFYGGEGHAAWVLVWALSLSVVPGVLLSAIPDPAARTVVIGLLAAGITAVSHGILVATTTPESQPPPDPVPLHDDGDRCAR